MEQLGTILRTVCLGLCVCGLGIGGLVAVFLGFTGGGIIASIKDILGIGERDEDDVIDEAMSSIHKNRQALKTKRTSIQGDGGIPDFDAAVAKFSKSSDSTDGDSFSSQSANNPSGGIRGLGGGNRFDTPSTGDGIRGKRSSRKNRDDYEIYDDGDFFGD
jgi:hypothetical protein